MFLRTLIFNYHNGLGQFVKLAIGSKDNNIKTGSKGDYIYRETDESDNEIISIMFDMKNEQDQTATKKKNEDFLKELDKDRAEKKCEYAVLVSLLETDNELYNTGIVDYPIVTLKCMSFVHSSSSLCLRFYVMPLWVR